MVAVVVPKTRSTWMILTVGLALLATGQPAEADPILDLADCREKTCITEWISGSVIRCTQGTGYAVGVTPPNGVQDDCYGVCPEGTFVGTYRDAYSTDCTGVGQCDNGSEGTIVVLVDGERRDGSPACPGPPEPEPDPEPADPLELVLELVDDGTHCADGTLGIGSPLSPYPCYAGIGSCGEQVWAVEVRSVYDVCVTLEEQHCEVANDYCVVLLSSRDCTVGNRDLGPAVVDIYRSSDNRVACVGTGPTS